MEDEATVQKLGIGPSRFLLACALLIGFAAGRSVAEAAGAISLESGAKSLNQLHEGEGMWVAASMVLLAFFVFASFRFLLVLGQRAVAVLARVETKPPAWVAFAIIACGVFCLLAAVGLQWHESSASASVSASLPAIDMPGFPKGITSTGAVSIRAKTSLMVPVTTVCVLLAGVVIIGVGVWSSIPPRPAAVAMQKRYVPDIRVEPVAGADRPLE